MELRGRCDGQSSIYRHRYVHVTLVRDRQRRGEGPQQQSIVISSVTNAPPIATFDAVCLGLTCTANALFSRDPDGSITRYAWDFGDGTTGDGAIVGHTYAAAGTYTMTLAVTDNRRNGHVRAHRHRRATAHSCRRPRWHGHGCPEQMERDRDDHRSRQRPLPGHWCRRDWGLERRYECHLHDDRRRALRGDQGWSSEDCERRLQHLKPHARHVRCTSSTVNHDPDGDSKGGAITVTRR